MSSVRAVKPERDKFSISGNTWYSSMHGRILEVMGKVVPVPLPNAGRLLSLSPSAASVLALSSPSSIIALLIPKYSELLAGGRRRIGAGMVGGGRRPDRGFQILALVAVAFFFFYVACSLGRGTKWMPRGLS